MPFSKELPEWFKTAVTPTNTKKTEGWGAGEHPPAALFNWFFNTSYLAIKELRDNAVHNDQKGVANGVASLDGTGDVPIGQADNILNWVKGFGIGGNSKSLTDQNLNNQATNGLYYVNGNTTNGPATHTTGFMIVQSLSNTNVCQIFTTFSRNMYVRTQNNGTWSAWSEIATYDATGKILPANLPAANTTTQGAVILNDNTNSTSTAQAATANAVKKVMDFILNAGIGADAKDISNSDLNNLDNTGFYRGNNLTNRPGTGPTTEWYYIQHIKHTTTYKVQVAFRLDNVNNTMHKRILSNSVWSEWTEISTTKFVADSISAAMTAHENKKNNPHEVTTEQVNIYIPAVNAADSGNNIPRGATVGSLPPNAVGYPMAWGTIANFKESNTRCVQYWYDTGEATNRRNPRYRTWYNVEGSYWSPWTELETTAGAQAKVDLTQKHKLTADDGTIKPIAAGTQINAVWTTGIYYVSAAALTNAPVNTIGVLEVHQYNANTSMQTYTVMDPASPRQFIRYGAGGSWGAWKESATVDKAQMQKITADSGTDKFVINTGEDMLAKLLTLGAGFHTFYYAGNVINAPTTGAGRGFFSKDAGNLGYIFIVDQTNTIYTCHRNNTVWSSWATGAVEKNMHFVDGIFGSVGTTVKKNVIQLKEGGATDGMGMAIGGGGYTVIGGGEAAQTLINDATYNPNSSIERLELASDNEILISPNVQGGTAAKKSSVFYANGNYLFPFASYTEAKVSGSVFMPSGVATTVIFASNSIDHLEEFGASTGKFTPTNPGVYQVNCSVDFTTTPPTSDTFLQLWKNNSLYVNLDVQTAKRFLSGSIAIKLAAGDYIEIKVNQSSGGAQKDISAANLTIAKIQ